MTPDQLVRADRVHRRVYTDPEIFALEMRRIFGRTWVFLAHESQVPKPGDFVLARIGLEEVIVVRAADRVIHGLINRCAHRGARIVTAWEGNAESFVCPYHAWQFRTDGVVASVPHRPSLASTTDDPRLSLARVARIESYRGFVFGNLSAEGPDLRAYLGVMTEAFDNMIDRSPEGWIEQAGGIFRQEYRGNWKLHQENANDVMHACFVHESSVAAAREDKRDYATPVFDAHQTHVQMLSNGFGVKDWIATGVWGTPEGHTFMGGFYRAGVLSPERTDAVWLDYRKRLAARLGEEKARAVVSLDRFNNLVFPNISVNAQYQQLRMVQPLAPDRSRVVVMCFRLKGAPPEFFRRAVRFMTNLSSPASMIVADDFEIFERCQAAVGSEQRDWIDLSRGFGSDTMGESGVRAAEGTSELPLRTQYAAWQRLMAAE